MTEVLAIIVAVFAALLAVERREKGAWYRDDPNTEDLDENEPDIIAGVGYTAPSTPAGAYRKAQKAAKSPVVERGRFKIAGKHGAYMIREKTPKGTATHGSVHTHRQAKEWMWCLHNGWNYQECKKAHRNLKARKYARAYRRNKEIEESNRDLELQAMEMGWGNLDFSTDERGYRTYYPPEGPGFRTYY